MACYSKLHRAVQGHATYLLYRSSLIERTLFAMHFGMSLSIGAAACLLLKKALVLAINTME